MTKITYDADTLKFFSFFESITGAKLKDCFVDGVLYFIVQKGQMGLALGKQAKNIKRLEGALKREFKVIEHDEDLAQFVKNAVAPLRKFVVQVTDQSVVIKGEDSKTKGLLIGRNRANLSKLESIVKRYFKIDQISVE